MNTEDKKNKHNELQAFLLLTGILAPLMTVAIVGGYGLMIWIYQLLNGPPTG